jgi:hypothetical protein
MATAAASAYPTHQYGNSYAFVVRLALHKAHSRSIVDDLDIPRVGHTRHAVKVLVFAEHLEVGQRWTGLAWSRQDELADSLVVEPLPVERLVMGISKDVTRRRNCNVDQRMISLWRNGVDPCIL